jgi:hypothetical protein
VKQLLLFIAGRKADLYANFLNLSVTKANVSHCRYPVKGEVAHWACSSDWHTGRALQTGILGVRSRLAHWACAPDWHTGRALQTGTLGVRSRLAHWACAPDWHTGLALQTGTLGVRSRLAHWVCAPDSRTCRISTFTHVGCVKPDSPRALVSLVLLDFRLLNPNFTSCDQLQWNASSVRFYENASGGSAVVSDRQTDMAEPLGTFL